MKRVLVPILPCLAAGLAWKYLHNGDQVEWVKHVVAGKSGPFLFENLTKHK